MPTDMKQKIFLLFTAFAICLLYRYRPWSWMKDVTNYACPSVSSHLLPKKPKHTNVAFIKTHKTASTTMQTMMFRFADNHNLTVMFPIKPCSQEFCYPKWFKPSAVHPETLSANILAGHMRFDRTELQRLMPNDTIYFTILREPGSLFDSTFHYYLDYCPAFLRAPSHSMKAFLEDPQRYYKPNEPYSQFAHNSMAFDLGIDNDHPATDAAFIQDFLAEVEQTFSLVMIADYFDESLVLLRHLLSWDLDDILYFRLNMRNESSKQRLTPDLVSKIRTWNSLDTYLYDYFNASLWRQIAALGPGCVEREVQELRQAQENLIQSCFQGQMSLRASKEISDPVNRPYQPKGNVDIMGYILPVNFSNGLSNQNKELCRKLIIPGHIYGNLLRDSQLKHDDQSHQHQPV